MPWTKGRFRAFRTLHGPLFMASHRWKERAFARADHAPLVHEVPPMQRFRPGYRRVAWRDEGPIGALMLRFYPHPSGTPGQYETRRSE